MPRYISRKDELKLRLAGGGWILPTIFGVGIAVAIVAIGSSINSSSQSNTDLEQSLWYSNTVTMEQLPELQEEHQAALDQFMDPDLVVELTDEFLDEKSLDSIAEESVNNGRAFVDQAGYDVVDFIKENYNELILQSYWMFEGSLYAKNQIDAIETLLVQEYFGSNVDRIVEMLGNYRENINIILDGYAEWSLENSGFLESYIFRPEAFKQFSALMDDPEMGLGDAISIVLSDMDSPQDYFTDAVLDVVRCPDENFILYLFAAQALRESDPSNLEDRRFYDVFVELYDLIEAEKKEFYEQYQAGVELDPNAVIYALSPADPSLVISFFGNNFIGLMVQGVTRAYFEESLGMDDWLPDEPAPVNYGGYVIEPY